MRPVPKPQKTGPKPRTPLKRSGFINRTSKKVRLFRDAAAEAISRGCQKAKEVFAEDAEYLADIRKCPCVVCWLYGFEQKTKTEVHHWIIGRGKQTRTPDGEALALCRCHHEGDLEICDELAIAVHREPKAFESEYGSEQMLSRLTRRLVEFLRENRHEENINWALLDLGRQSWSA